MTFDLGDREFGEGKLGDSSGYNVQQEILASTSLTDIDEITNTVDGRIISASADTFDSVPFTSTDVEPDDVLVNTIRTFANNVTGTVAETEDVLINAIVFDAIRFRNTWAIDRNLIGQTIEETREWSLLEITLRYGAEDEDNIRAVLDKSGKSELLNRGGGGFQTIDTGSDNLIVLQAPTNREKLRTVDSWFIDDYSRDLVSRDGDVYNITFELLPLKEKSFDNEYGSFDTEPVKTQDNEQWYFDFEFGDIVTSNVAVASEEVPEGNLDVSTITLICNQEQARIIEENASYLNTVRSRSIPDGTDVIDDTSEDTRQTVSIEPPGTQTKPLAPDEYVIQEWSTEWQGGSFSVEMTVVRTQ